MGLSQASKQTNPPTKQATNQPPQKNNTWLTKSPSKTQWSTKVSTSLVKQKKKLFLVEAVQELSAAMSPTELRDGTLRLHLVTERGAERVGSRGWVAGGICFKKSFKRGEVGQKENP